MTNDLELVVSVLSRLRAAGLDCALFGGWAEELRGIRAPGPHKDIDLLIEATDFTALDAFLAASPDWLEIEAKRFAHKRAFLAHGAMVELFLVRSAGDERITMFWGEHVFAWRAPLTEPLRALDGLGLRAASAANLTHYRASHDQVSAWRSAQLGSR